MKVAIVAGGHCTEASKVAFATFENYFGRQNVTKIVSTWKHSNVRSIEDVIQPDVIDIEDFGAVQSLLASEAAKFRFFWPTIGPRENTLAMWHKWHRLRDLCSQRSVQYILKTRLDVNYGSDPDMESFREAVHACEAQETIAIPLGGDHHGGINDVLAFGPLRPMLHYLSIYPHRWRLFCSAGMFHPETLLRVHLINDTSLSVWRFNFALFLKGHYNRHSESKHQDNARYQMWPLRRRLDLCSRHRIADLLDTFHLRHVWDPLK
jgi:hypothetical protein